MCKSLFSCQKEGKRTIWSKYNISTSQRASQLLALAKKLKAFGTKGTKQQWRFLNSNLLCDLDNFQVHSVADCSWEQVFEIQATERETEMKKEMNSKPFFKITCSKKYFFYFKSMYNCQHSNSTSIMSKEIIVAMH